MLPLHASTLPARRSQALLVQTFNHPCPYKHPHSDPPPERWCPCISLHVTSHQTGGMVQSYSVQAPLCHGPRMRVFLLQDPDLPKLHLGLLMTPSLASHVTGLLMQCFYKLFYKIPQCFYKLLMNNDQDKPPARSQARKIKPVCISVGTTTDHL